MKHMVMAFALVGMLSGSAGAAAAMPTTGLQRHVTAGMPMRSAQKLHRHAHRRHLARHGTRTRHWAVRYPAPAPMIVATAAYVAPVEAPRPRCSALCPGVMILGVGF